MKLAGFFLLPAGWLIIVAAVVLFPGAASRWVFTLAGVCIQAAGLWLLCCASRSLRESVE